MATAREHFRAAERLVDGATGCDGTPSSPLTSEDYTGSYLLAAIAHAILAVAAAVGADRAMVADLYLPDNDEGPAVSATEPSDQNPEGT